MNDKQIQEMMLEHGSPPSEFMHVWGVDWCAGIMTFTEDQKKLPDHLLVERAKRHFGRIAKTFTPESLVSFWILAHVLDDETAERYFVPFREYIFQRDWCEMNLQFSPRWVVAWLRLACFSMELESKLRWYVSPPG